MVEKKEFYQVAGYIIRSASYLGFFKVVEPTGTCTHVGCGGKSRSVSSRCSVKTYWHQDDDEIKKHEKCSRDWCKVKLGPKPTNKKQTCKRKTLLPVSSQEAADPAFVPSFIAMECIIWPFAGTYTQNWSDIIMLYDLEKDEWFDQYANRDGSSGKYLFAWDSLPRPKEMPILETLKPQFLGMIY